MIRVMSEQLVHYLQLISKLSDILTYIDTNFTDNDLSSYIKECKSICINKAKEDPLMTIFLRELSNEKLEPQEVETQDIELKGQIDVLANMLTDSIQLPQQEKMSPESCVKKCSGLAKLFKMNSSVEETPQPQKVNNKINEINLTNSNINFEIKRK
jgi:hypothetical protein